MAGMSPFSATLEAFDMESIYRVIGCFLFAFALLVLADRRTPKRWGSALFVGLYGVTFAFGAVLPAAVTGGCVVLMGLVVVLIGVHAGQGQHALPSKECRRADAERFGLWLFSPFLLSLGLTLSLHWYLNVDLLVAFGASNLVILLFLMPLMRETPIALVRDGRRMFFDAMGWFAILPQLLVALGAVFEAAGVGDIALEMAESFVEVEGKLAVAAVYCIATAFFAMMMGNAFPAFLVVSSGIGIPLVVKRFGADPAIAGVIAMLSGYCGTLMTPMGVNFNTLPAERLGIRSMNEVLKVQAGTAFPLLLINIALMYFLAF